jgi:hypothetical protein
VLNQVLLAHGKYSLWLVQWSRIKIRSEQMPNQVVEIKVSIPDGYVFDSFRIPYPGDLYMVDGDVRERKCDTSIGFPCLIVRKDWVWPDWLKAGWIAMDEDGEWYAYNYEPEPGKNVWFPVDDGDMSFLGIDLFRFDPPPCDDWKKSLRANPAYK